MFLTYSVWRIIICDTIYVALGLLVLNRPYGLKKDDYQEKSNKKKINIATTPASEKINHLSFTGVLEYLKDALNVSDLNILKAPDRYYIDKYKISRLMQNW